LGSYCEVALQLRYHNLRKEAYSFDWLETLSNESIIGILDNDFEGFLDDQYYVSHPKYPFVIENTLHEFEFRHEEPDEKNKQDPEVFERQFEKISNKYKRRIQRFRDIKNYKGKVIFIRSAFDFNNEKNPYWGDPSQAFVTAAQAQNLKNCLERYFPDIDFLLVIINHADQEEQGLSRIKGIREFKIRKSYLQEDYRKMFKVLKKFVAKKKTFSFSHSCS